MHEFSVYGIGGVIYQLSGVVSALEAAVGRGESRPSDADAMKRCDSLLQYTYDVCDAYGLSESAKIADLAKFHLSSAKWTDTSMVVSELRHVLEAIMMETERIQFARIAQDRNGFANQDALFGPDVKTAFPSAEDDIRDAGNCLAVECSTAAVFHLMRVAECGLRALAFDRDVVVAKGGNPIPIELATWEEVIKELEKAEDEIRNFPRTEARERQYSFYHGAMGEIRRFKNILRNPVMHNRDSYDRDQAHSAFVHVRAFMKILATKIAEGAKTPKVWA